MELMQMTMETRSIVTHLTKAILALAGVAKSTPKLVEFNTRHGKITTRTDKIEYFYLDKRPDVKGVVVGFVSGQEVETEGMTYDEAVAKWRDAL